MKRLLLISTLMAAALAFHRSGGAQTDECPTPINGARVGESGNLQDHTFHSLAIDPKNENVVYVGTEANGIFKTVDGGVWTRLRQGLKCTAQHTGYSQIFDIAIDPKDTRTVYASTVNGPGPGGNPLYPSASGGVYKSTDGGLSWTQKIKGFTNTYTTYVLVDSANTRRLYAGLGGVKSTFPFTQNVFFEGGIWASEDAGESWSPLPTLPGLNTNIFADMVLRGKDQQILYVSGQLHRDDATTAYGLVRSRDGGKTWKAVNPPGVLILGFDAFLQDPNILYGHDDSPGRRVHKSTDGGDTWSDVPAGFFGVIRIHPTDSRTLFYTGRTSIMRSTDGFLTSRSVYNDTALTTAQQMTDIKIAPSNPKVVWAAAKGYYLYRSTDGGETFTKITAVRDAVYGPASASALVSDFNSDGRVNFDDFFLFAAGFGKRKGEAGFSAAFDLNGDGQVNFDDFFLFAADFGRTTK